MVPYFVLFEGFKGKENIDLFKHYLRMYLKNKFMVNQIKKEKALMKNPSLDFKSVLKDSEANKSKEEFSMYKGFAYVTEDNERVNIPS